MQQNVLSSGQYTDLKYYTITQGIEESKITLWGFEKVAECQYSFL
jgi:hypothetical protein